MSDARRLATGSLAQQAAQVSGLVAMFAVITVLARELSLAELGVYGLLSSLAGYLLIVQNAAAGAAVRAMAAARDEREGSAAFSTSALMYVGAGALAAVALTAVGLILAATLDLTPELARQTRLGAAAAGAVALVGWPLTAYRDALRARARFVLGAAAETVGIVASVGIVLALVLADAPLWALIGTASAIPLLAGAACMVAARATRLPWRLRPRLATRAAARDFLGLAGYISLAEASSAVVYVATRVVLGIARTPATVGLYEGPVRIHNLFRALNGAVTVTVLPTAVRYSAEGDDRRLRELLVRGCRYALAGVVPIAIVGMALAAPILDAWLGSEFRQGGAALAIMLSHWLLDGVLGVTGAMLVAVGAARELARWAMAVGATTVVLALVLVPWLGLDGAALAMAIPYVALFPYMLRITLRAVPVPLAELARRAFAPAWALGAALAAPLAVVRLTLDPDGPVAVAGVALIALTVYWAAYYALALDRGERALVRALALRDPGRR
ncbi:MAG TPA: polysaccharide biosynthesis C-terminal domain-containing protein [Solirubrobacteraceae bacterium]|nr:polysaccharide biosynthesis C-terminal domain-containing protein [Solirubrobacteraceae bacterium]